jgi:hypothetical protein
MVKLNHYVSSSSNKAFTQANDCAKITQESLSKNIVRKGPLVFRENCKKQILKRVPNILELKSIIVFQTT